MEYYLKKNKKNDESVYLANKKAQKTIIVFCAFLS